MLTFSLLAENKGKTFNGNVLFGYRMVDISGARNKYKEDINLYDGARLFNLSLQFTPDEGVKKLFDRLDLNVNNFGGDPFETFCLSIQKYGKYKFQYDRKKSSYFYGDLYEVGGGLYDTHTFNFDRTSDSGFLKIWLGDNLNLYMNYDRSSKEGDSITTYDINRIEFEFDKPLKEEMKEVTVGIDFHTKSSSIILEEKIQDFDSTNSLFLPGYTDGGPKASYPSSLNFFNLSQPYTFTTYTHTFKVNSRPLNRLFFAGSMQISNQDMNLTFSENAEGLNYLGRCFSYSYTGDGTFNRLMHLYDLDASYLLFDKLAVIGAVRFHEFEQAGAMVIEEERESSTLKFDTLVFEGGLQYQFLPTLALTLGYRNEGRTLDGLETVDYEEKTQRNGFFGNLKMDLTQAFKLTLDYQRGDYDNPFTLISPTDFDRYRITAKLRLKQVNISGSYLLNKSKTEVFDTTWKSDKNQLNFRMGYHTEMVKIFAGYSYIDIEQSGSRSIAYPPSWSGAAGTFLWDILYEGKSSLLDASLSYNLGESWKIGGYVNSYSNTGFWEISRTTLKGYLEYSFSGGFIAQIGYRFVDFDEKSSNKNDYKANILEVSFGHRWE